MLKVRCLLVLSVFLLIGSSFARADVGLVLAEATPHGMSLWTKAGHAAIYFSRICPASPVRLRLCQPDENGSVLNNYEFFDEDRPYAWNIVPLNIYLYGVEAKEQRPLFASSQLRSLLQQQFLEHYLHEICSGLSCNDNPRAHWRELVAGSFVRGMYIFIVKTTVEQDESLISELNSRPNVNHYNGFRNNCADFTERLINTYFPGAAHRDFLNDFGMTSPKAIAKSFAHFAEKHPELDYRVVHIPQMPGDFKHSTDCRKGTEVAFRSRRWLVPMLLKTHELALFATSYMLTGRFNPQSEFEHHAADFNPQWTAEAGQDAGDTAELIATEIGPKEAWHIYSNALAGIRSHDDPVGAGSPVTPIQRLAREFDAHGRASMDAAGQLWVEVPTGDGSTRKVGASPASISSAGSDPVLAYEIMLARLQVELKSAPKRRESLPQFQADWQLLQGTRAEFDRFAAAHRQETSLDTETTLNAGQSFH